MILFVVSVHQLNRGDNMKTSLTLLLLIFTLTSFASGKFQTEQHKEIYSYIQNLMIKNPKLKPREVLIVYDIDNTVLAMDHNFGSDQWFNWQKEELAAQSSLSVAKNFQELISIQYQIFSISKMHLTETVLSPLISNLQSSNFRVMALTSRGPGIRNVTERELASVKIDFTTTAPGHSIPNSFIPQGQQRLASYQNGIFMTSGMHKGEMLELIVNRFNKNYKHIIFIDDHKKHTDRVFESFNNSKSKISTFRYAREDKRVLDFKNSNKIESIELARELKRLAQKLKRN